MTSVRPPDEPKSLAEFQSVVGESHPLGHADQTAEGVAQHLLHTSSHPAEGTPRVLMSEGDIRKAESRYYSELNSAISKSLEGMKEQLSQITAELNINIPQLSSAINSVLDTQMATLQKEISKLRSHFPKMKPSSIEMSSFSSSPSAAEEARRQEEEARKAASQRGSRPTPPKTS